MARTQAADYGQRREAIVEKAAQLFAATGFRGTSVADLAASCATSKSLIYHYYPSKEDILHAVMASHVDQLLDDVETATTGERSARDKLTRLFAAFMRHYVGAADRQKVLLNELASLPEPHRAGIVGKQRRIVAAVEALLVAIHPVLAGDRARARALTMLVFGMLNWTKTWFDPEGPLSADQVAALILDRATAPLQAS